MAFSSPPPELNRQVSQIQMGDNVIHLRPGTTVADVIEGINSGRFDTFLSGSLNRSKPKLPVDSLEEVYLIADLLGTSEHDYERRAKIFDLLNLDCCQRADCPQQMAINQLKARQTSADFATSADLKQVIYSVLLDTLLRQGLETGTLDKRIRDAVRDVLREQSAGGSYPYNENYPDDTPTLEMPIPLYGNYELPKLTWSQRLRLWRSGINVRLFNVRTRWHAFLASLWRER